MTKRVTFTVEVPEVGATEGQIHDWIRWRLNALWQAGDVGELIRYSTQAEDVVIEDVKP